MKELNEYILDKFDTTPDNKAYTFTEYNAELISNILINKKVI